MSEKKSTELVKLDGTVVKSDGTTYKSNYFKGLGIREDDYSDVAFTREEAQKFRASVLHLVTGASAAVPLNCGGENVCPFAARCPFVRLTQERRKKDPAAKSLVPVGRKCLVEISLLEEWTNLYMNEFEVEEKNFSEFQMVRELAEMELLMWRINNNLAKPEHAELVEDVAVGVDKHGNALTRREPSALMNMKEKLWGRKSKLHKLMIGDREGKIKRDVALHRHSEEDSSISSAKLHLEMKKLLKQTKHLDLKIKAAEGKVIDASTATVTTLTPDDLINQGVEENGEE